MTPELTIVPVEGVNRLDSRLLATRLGYEHKVLLQSIRRHKERLEQKSSLLHFEAVKPRTTRGATRETYYLLTERQCLLLTGSLKKGDEALEWQTTLIDAFLQARQRLHELEAQRPQPSSTHTITDALRPRALKNLSAVPDGYFSVLGELFKHLYNLEALVNGSLDAEAMLEISVGQCWSRYARATVGIAEHQRCKYTHCCKDGRIVQAWAYPIQYVNTFATWFWTVYVAEHFPAYQQYRARRVALPAPGSHQKRIGS